jgi:two-component system response regulator DesR
VISALVAENVLLLRRGLVAVLSSEPDIEVIAEVEQGDQVMPAALFHGPDVAIIDSDLPGLDSFSVARLLSERLPGCGVLVMAAHPKARDLHRVVAAGAHGLVPTEAPKRYMANAVRQIAGGKKFVDPDLVVAALDPGDNPLTARELEILRMTGLGKSPDEIAGDLRLASGTVRNYLTRITNKIGARNRIDALRIADEKGWI